MTDHPGPEVSEGNPHAVYTEAAQTQALLLAEWQKKARRLSNLRLVLFLLTGLLAWLAFGSQQIGAIWVLLAVASFGILMILHERVLRKGQRSERTLAFYRRGLARLEERWMGGGDQGLDHPPTGHPYADDLDLFGEGSLFELLNSARTAAGRRTLAQWMLEPSSAETARQRQAAVQELMPRGQLRLDLSLLGEEVGERALGQTFIEWGQAPPVISSSMRVALRLLAIVTSSMTLLGLAGWIWSEAGVIPFLLAAALQVTGSLFFRKSIRAIVDSVEAPGQELVVLSGLLGRIEEESFTASRLATLRDELAASGQQPSVRIQQLRRLLDLLDARRNQFFAPLAGLFCWTTHLALSLENWRSTCGDTLEPWIEAAAEIEVLCSLSAYAYENPENTFPEWIESGPAFEAHGLGHPLLPAAQCVRNDLSLGGERRVLMMSGSNMSGKSTLLRTVGTACVMAMMGLPIRGNRLRLSPLQIAASIRITDSLQQGASHFFAEIQRLRMVVDLTSGSWPVLFLLDEVLHGTNSHDRRIGAEAVIRGLIEREALGIVTTHDLALAQIEEVSRGRIVNVHFEDQFDGDQMRFDYRLRPGVVTRSNALELMRSIGLDV
ncbi:MAG: DNA mismatch repair protein MutS [Myxococcota bacterium]|nr:DNA mismatch repair protein MutS [Myxococcota bacterium]